MESESKVLVDRVAGNIHNGAWNIAPILEEVNTLSSSFSEVCWKWAPRSVNRAAHLAAKIGSRAVEPECWVERPPPSLVGVLGV
ncbi:unnamed protein product [Prunus armeniaca]|uniref:RNase H type-1 domain-containing protein n=1 Tax=Prunus armeniaca TaxID=36596 RepID=A0A6J5V6X4_PRUAR|nr:unnamed protein product [Prunus armeniaca]CAB4315173.1 unnamed protein product [Prunus armeniaca]